MKVKNSHQGFGVISLLVVVTILAIVGISSWLVYRHNRPTVGVSQTTTQTYIPITNRQASSSQAKKTLDIKEWGVGVVLPDALANMVTYSITKATDPDSLLPLEAAHIYAASSIFPGNTCTPMPTSIGTAVSIAALYVRSDNSKPFNAARYKGTTKASIFVDGSYSYHLNYLTPDCIGSTSEANTALLHEIQNDLAKLTKDS